MYVPLLLLIKCSFFNTMKQNLSHWADKIYFRNILFVKCGKNAWFCNSLNKVSSLKVILWPWKKVCFILLFWQWPITGTYFRIFHPWVVFYDYIVHPHKDMQRSFHLLHLSLHIATSTSVIIDICSVRTPSWVYPVNHSPNS